MPRSSGASSSTGNKYFESDSDEDDVGPRVRLNVYDIADVGACVDIGDMLTTLNQHTLATWEVGVFHAGVEILGVEYSYGYCETGTGVYTCEPRSAYGARFRKSVELGRARRDWESIERRIARLVKVWEGGSYALLGRNCCHFADTMCQDLGVGSIPKWVNGLAESLSGYADWPLDPLGISSIMSDYKAHPALCAPQQHAKDETEQERDSFSYPGEHSSFSGPEAALWETKHTGPSVEAFLSEKKSMRQDGIFTSAVACTVSCLQPNYATLDETSRIEDYYPPDQQSNHAPSKQRSSRRGSLATKTTPPSSSSLSSPASSEDKGTTALMLRTLNEAIAAVTPLGAKSDAS